MFPVFFLSSLNSSFLWSDAGLSNVMPACVPRVCIWFNLFLFPNLIQLPMCSRSCGIALCATCAMNAVATSVFVRNDENDSSLMAG